MLADARLGRCPGPCSHVCASRLEPASLQSWGSRRQGCRWEVARQPPARLALHNPCQLQPCPSRQAALPRAPASNCSSGFHSKRGFALNLHNQAVSLRASHQACFCLALAGRRDASRLHTPASRTKGAAAREARADRARPTSRGHSQGCRARRKVRLTRRLERWPLGKRASSTWKAARIHRARHVARAAGGRQAVQLRLHVHGQGWEHACCPAGQAGAHSAPDVAAAAAAEPPESVAVWARGDCNGKQRPAELRVGAAPAGGCG